MTTKRAEISEWGRRRDHDRSRSHDPTRRRDLHALPPSPDLANRRALVQRRTSLTCGRRKSHTRAIWIEGESAGPNGTLALDRRLAFHSRRLEPTMLQPRVA